MQQELAEQVICRCPICKAGSGAERSLLEHLKEVHGYSDYQAERMVMRLRAWSTCEPALEMPVLRDYISDLFSPYQMEILELVAQGKTSEEIAVALRSSIQSIADHTALMCRILGVADGSEAIASLAGEPPAANVNDELLSLRSVFL